MACTCKNCGGLYDIDFLVSDELWEQINPNSNGSGLLCGTCIIRKIEELKPNTYHLFSSEDISTALFFDKIEKISLPDSWKEEGVEEPNTIANTKLKLKNVKRGFVSERDGLGCTVRKGLKWSNHKGEPVELWECEEFHYGDCDENCKCHGEALIVGVWVNRIDDLPPSLYYLMDEDLNTKEKLMMNLKNCYGTINEEDILTAIVYRRI